MDRSKKRQRTLLFQTCSLLMGALFAYSASVQLNDPDWYFWFFLYALASGINLLRTKSASTNFNKITVLVAYGGILLFLKVLIEAYNMHGIGGLWWLDMKERVVREKLGSGLVVISMFLQLKTSSCVVADDICFLITGMTSVVAVSFGLTFWFFVFVK